MPSLQNTCNRYTGRDSRVSVKLELDLSKHIVEKLRRYCTSQDVSESDVVEHVLEEWYTSLHT